MRRHLPIALTILIVLALPASARAETFCAPSPCAGDSQHAEIQEAIDAADTDPGEDVVAIAPGTHTAPVSGLSVDQADTEVRGAGTDQTIVTGAPLTAVNLSYTLISGYMSRLSDLTLRLPTAVTASPSTATGAIVVDGTVERVRVDAEGAQFGAGINDGQGQGLEVRRGAIRDVVVDLGLEKDAAGIRVGTSGPPGVQLEDVQVTARNHALLSDPEAVPEPATVTARRLVLRSHRPVVVADGYLELADAVLDASSDTAFSAEDLSIGARVFDGRSDPTGLTLDRVTLVGNGDPQSSAFAVAAQGSTPAAYLRARHVVATGFARAVVHQNFGSVPRFHIDYSNVPSGAGAIVDGTPGNGPPDATLGPGNVDGAALLGADLRPLAGSPAIDIGGESILAGGATDLGGEPRELDGDGNGSVLVDAGAYETRYAADGARISIGDGPIKLNKRGVGRVQLECPPANEQPGPCAAALTLATRGKVKLGGAKRKLTYVRDKAATVEAATTAAVEFRLRGRKLAAVRESGKARKVRAIVRVIDRYGETGTAAKALKLKPKRR